MLNPLLMWSAFAEGPEPPPEAAGEMALHAPLAPAVLDSAGAIEAARRAGYVDAWLSRPGVTAEYGSYNPKMTHNGRPTTTTDAWKITIPDLDIPRPAGPIGSPPAPHMHTFVIFIDDKTGKFLIAFGY